MECDISGFDKNAMQVIQVCGRKRYIMYYRRERKFFWSRTWFFILLYFCDAMAFTDFFSHFQFFSKWTYIEKKCNSCKLNMICMSVANSCLTAVFYLMFLMKTVNYDCSYCIWNVEFVLNWYFTWLLFVGYIHDKSL